MCRVTDTHGSLRGSHCEVNSISSGNYFVPLLIGAVKLNNKKIRSNYNQNIKINNDFNSYLAGLFEGDGHIII